MPMLTQCSGHVHQQRYAVNDQVAHVSGEATHTFTSAHLASKTSHLLVCVQAM